VLAPVNADEFSIVVTHRDAALALAINRGVIAVMIEEELMSRQSPHPKPDENPVETGSGARPIVREGQGRLRGDIPGLDSPDPPLAVGVSIAAAEPLQSRIPQPSKTSVPQTPVLPAMQHLYVVDPPTLPDRRAINDQLSFTSGGAIAGFLLGATLVLRRRRRQP
jgi:hypothetical protein